MNLEQYLEDADKYVEESNFLLENVPQLYKDIYLINSLNFDLANGGVYQWLINRCGNYADDTICALKRVGALNVARIVQDIVDDFPDQNIPKNELVRIKLIESMVNRVAQQWTEKGDLILEWPDDIDSLLRAYVKE